MQGSNLSSVRKISLFLSRFNSLTAHNNVTDVFLVFLVFFAGGLQSFMSYCNDEVLNNTSYSAIKWSCKKPGFMWWKPKMSGVFFKNPAQICWMTSSIHETQSYKCQNLNWVKGWLVYSSMSQAAPSGGVLNQFY